MTVYTEDFRYDLVPIVVVNTKPSAESGELNAICASAVSVTFRSRLITQPIQRLRGITNLLLCGSRGLSESRKHHGRSVIKCT
jgi:hypothetical protein